MNFPLLEAIKFVKSVEDVHHDLETRDYQKPIIEIELKDQGTVQYVLDFETKEFESEVFVSVRFVKYDQEKATDLILMGRLHNELRQIEADERFSFFIEPKTGFNNQSQDQLNAQRHIKVAKSIAEIIDISHHGTKERLNNANFEKMMNELYDSIVFEDKNQIFNSTNDGRKNVNFLVQDNLSEYHLSLILEYFKKLLILMIHLMKLECREDTITVIAYNFQDQQPKDLSEQPKQTQQQLRIDIVKSRNQFRNVDNYLNYLSSKLQSIRESSPESQDFLQVPHLLNVNMNSFRYLFSLIGVDSNYLTDSNSGYSIFSIDLTQSIDEQTKISTMLYSTPNNHQLVQHQLNTLNKLLDHNDIVLNLTNTGKMTTQNRKSKKLYPIQNHHHQLSQRIQLRIDNIEPLNIIQKGQITNRPISETGELAAFMDSAQTHSSKNLCRQYKGAFPVQEAFDNQPNNNSFKRNFIRIDEDYDDGNLNYRVVEGNKLSILGPNRDMISSIKGYKDTLSFPQSKSISENMNGDEDGPTIQFSFLENDIGMNHMQTIKRESILFVRSQESKECKQLNFSESFLTQYHVQEVTLAELKIMDPNRCVKMSYNQILIEVDQVQDLNDSSDLAQILNFIKDNIIFTKIALLVSAANKSIVNENNDKITSLGKEPYHNEAFPDNNCTSMMQGIKPLPEHLDGLDKKDMADNSFTLRETNSNYVQGTKSFINNKREEENPDEEQKQMDRIKVDDNHHSQHLFTLQGKLPPPPPSTNHGNIPFAQTQPQSLQRSLPPNTQAGIHDNNNNKSDLIMSFEERVTEKYEEWDGKLRFIYEGATEKGTKELNGGKMDRGKRVEDWLRDILKY